MCSSDLFIDDMLAASVLGLRRTKETLRTCLEVNDLQAVLRIEEAVQMKLASIDHQARLESFVAARRPPA